jgi:hypothetical protein
MRALVVAGASTEGQERTSVIWGLMSASGCRTEIAGAADHFG